MQAQNRANGLDAVLAAALEAAADRVGQRVQGVILTARLATAVHMCRAAELVAAQQGERQALHGPNTEAAQAPATCAASVMRGEGRR